MKKLLLTIVLLVPMLVMAVPTPTPKDFVWLHAGKDTLGNPVSVTGYVIYCGTQSRNYTVSLAVGPVLTTPVALVLTADGNYFCAVTAKAGQYESAYSAEITVPFKNGVVQVGGIPAAATGFGIH